MKYTTCQNCYSSYESDLERCPDCNASQGEKDDGLIVFTEEARSEISRLGGIVYDVIHLPEYRYLIPCEWGVLLYNNAKKSFWHYLCGIVDAVVVNEYVEITHGDKRDYLTLDDGRLIKRENIG
ncbi:hypothetical protein [Serratia fonticola]|uniref:hypothetical protein n=1 Tax=Serratia fonticola TaxID=47917 RepID=UPI00164522ED|nr:hypothetical protein [Serratia fonticola]MBC3216351.1 hypothetical protein [Serratia fonticola]